MQKSTFKIIPLSLPEIKFNLPYLDRIEVEADLFKLFPNGLIVCMKVDQILNKDVISFSSNEQKLKLKHSLLNTFYDELFYDFNMQEIILNDYEYSNAFSIYLNTRRIAKTKETYKEILSSFYNVQTRIFFKYFSHLRKSDSLLIPYLIIIEDLINFINNKGEKGLNIPTSQKRSYVTNGKYSLIMFQQFFDLNNKERYLQEEAADMVLKVHFGEDYEFMKKASNASFIKQATKSFKRKSK